MTNVSKVRKSPVICWSVHVKMCSFLRTSWQVMSPESTGTTRRQNSSRHSGRISRLRCQRRGTRYKAKQRSCYWRFFYSEGIVHYEYAPDGQTINKEFYLEVLWRLRESVRRKRREKWRDGDWILHHDNAPTHTSHLVQQFLAKHGTARLQQPPYSADLATCDFFLFPRLNP